MSRDRQSAIVLVVPAAAALLIGFLLGRLTVPNRAPDHQTSPEGIPQSQPSHTMESSAPSRAVEENQQAGCEEQLDDLRATFAELNQDFEAYKTDLEGVPLDWSEDIPEEYHADAFRNHLMNALRNCTEGDQSLGHVDCSEPNCLFILYRQNTEWFSQDDWWYTCPEWTDQYGASISQAGGSANCEDGTEQSYLILGPSPQYLEDPGLRDNYFKRWKARVRRLQQETPCAETSK